ncbi:MAG: DUF2442 domain-containing protein [Bacteroidota bacterium]
MGFPFSCVTCVVHRGAYQLQVTFSDNATYAVDLADELEGEIFRPLKDPTLFVQVYVDPETRTVAWPNGADLAPEFLRAIGTPILTSSPA